MDIKNKTIQITKTARFYLLGEPGPTTREVWFVLHGYGQLAAEFIQGFTLLNNSSRVIVAVEALHRFYINSGSGRVGASWMTREDRENEITDYIAYLDRVYAETLAPLKDRPVKITVLGFSQGTATACRWTLLGNSPINQLILWGGDFPADIPLENCRPRLENLDIHLVVGEKDPYIKPEILQEHTRWLKGQEIHFQLATFNGGHEIYVDLLVKLAG